MNSEFEMSRYKFEWTYDLSMGLETIQFTCRAESQACYTWIMKKQCAVDISNDHIMNTVQKSIRSYSLYKLGWSQPLSLPLCSQIGRKGHGSMRLGASNQGPPS